MRLCKTCPFGKSKEANKFWGKDKCDQIEECAIYLHEERKQVEPHPCFETVDGVVLAPAKPDQTPCGGHFNWLKSKGLIKEQSND